MRRYLDCGQMERLFGILQGDGYEVVGPTIRDGVIAYDRLSGSSDLPPCLRVFGVEGQSFQFGEALSPAVAASLPLLCDEILQLL